MARIKPAYKSDPAPRVVSAGTVSHPRKPSRPRLGRIVADATPRSVKQQGTNANG